MTPEQSAFFLAIFRLLSSYASAAVLQQITLRHELRSIMEQAY